MLNRFVENLLGYVDLSDKEIAALEAATSQPKSFGPRQDLIREGDKLGPVFVVLEGWAIRYKILPNGLRQIMAFLMPGDACDLHIGMLAEMDHSIQTVTAAKVANIDGEVMGELMSAHQGISRAMYIAQLTDESTLWAWIVSLGRHSGIESVAHLLLELYVRGIRAGISATDKVEFPLSQTVLAGGTRHDTRAYQPGASGTPPLRRDRVAGWTHAPRRSSCPDPAFRVRRQVPAQTIPNRRRCQTTNLNLLCCFLSN